MKSRASAGQESNLKRTAPGAPVRPRRGREPLSSAGPLLLEWPGKAPADREGPGGPEPDTAQVQYHICEWPGKAPAMP